MTVGPKKGGQASGLLLVRCWKDPKTGALFKSKWLKCDFEVDISSK